MLKILFALSLGIWNGNQARAELACANTPCGGCMNSTATAHIKKDKAWTELYEKLWSKYKIRPVSCYRSYACQEQLWNCFNSHGQRGRAAPPGRSNHQNNVAMDVSANKATNAWHLAQEIIQTKYKKPLGHMYHVVGHNQANWPLHMSNSSSEGSRSYLQRSSAVKAYRQRKNLSITGYHW